MLGVLVVLMVLVMLVVLAVLAVALAPGGTEPVTKASPPADVNSVTLPVHVEASAGIVNCPSALMDSCAGCLMVKFWLRNDWLESVWSTRTK